MNESKPQFDVYYYLGIIKRRKWFFIIPLIVVYIGFLAASLLLPKEYEAKAVILIEEHNIVNPLLKNLAVSNTVASRLSTLREEILAWPRIFQLVEKLGLNKNTGSPLGLERLIAGIRRNISLKMKSKNIITISYYGKYPRSTQELVNTLCNILIQRNLSLQNKNTASAIDFINKQLNIYKDKLNKSEDSLRKFKEVYGAGMVGNTGQSSSRAASYPLNDTYPAGATLTQVNQQLANLQADLVMALVDCTPQHPRVKSLKARIASLKEKRNQYIKGMAQRAGVKPSAYVSIADSFPRQQEELVRLSRDKAINERIYAMLLQRLESANITERLDNSENRTKFRIVEPARLPLVPIKPNKLKLNLLGILLGSMSGIGFVYLLEYTDSSFKREEDIKNVFGYPVLGSISKIITEDDQANKNRFGRKVTYIILAFIILLVLIIILVMKNHTIFLWLSRFFSNILYKIAGKGVNG